MRRGKPLDFFKLMKQLQIPFSDLRFLLKKGTYNYKAGASAGDPLLNDYHFKH
jgi:hypothetical protein